MQLDMGDVPGWLQVAGGSAQLAQAMWAHHKARSDDFRSGLEARSGLSPDAIAARVASDPALASLLLASIEEAMRTASEKKRHVLAAVTASAFTDPTASIDELRVHQRTAASLEEHDMIVLTEIATPRPENLAELDPGALQWDDISSVLPSDLVPTTLKPILAHLISLALVEDSAVGTWDYTPRWRISEYGFRFLQYLPVDRDLFNSAVIVCSWHGTRLRVRNLGWGDATVQQLSASWDGNPLAEELPQNLRVRAGELMEISVNDEVPNNAVVRMTIDWTDPDGTPQRFEGTKAKRSAHAEP